MTLFGFTEAEQNLIMHFAEACYNALRILHSQAPVDKQEAQEYEAVAKEKILVACRDHLMDISKIRAVGRNERKEIVDMALRTGEPLRHTIPLIEQYILNGKIAKKE